MEWETFVRFFSAAAAATLRQIAAVLGIVFLFGTALFLLSKFTRTIYHASGRAWLDRYATGWIGTPVHELGHAAFCILFRHRITAMKLFPGGARDGSLGYVEHAFDRKSIYQQIGNFFIGAGPLISGTLVLYVLAATLMPGRGQAASLIAKMNATGAAAEMSWTILPMLASAGMSAAAAVFAPTNVTSPGFWVFLYLSLCVSSHMGLSPSDVKGMLIGLAAIVLALLVVNCIALTLGANVDRYVPAAGAFAAGFAGLFIWAVIISTINFLFSYLVLAILHYRKYGRLLRIL